MKIIISKSRPKGLLLWLFLMVVLLMIITIAPVIIIEINADRKDFDSRIKSSFNTLKNIFASPIMGFAIETANSQLIKTSVSEALKHDFITRVKVTNNAGTTLYSAINPSYREGINQEETIIKVRSIASIYSSLLNTELTDDAPSTDVAPDNIVGYVTINTTNSAYEKAKYLRLTKYLYLFLAITAVLLATFYFVIWRVAQNVTGILQKANRLADGEKGVLIDEISNIRELSEFARHFNSISGKLDAERERIRAEDIENVEKSSILQIATHDIRTPIAHIKSRLSISLSLVTDDDVKKQILHCLNCINGLDRQVISTLNLTAIKQGNMKVRQIWINTRSLLDKIIEPFHTRAEENAFLQLHIDIEDAYNENDILIDVDLVSIAISNAIENAIKYTDYGCVRIIGTVSSDVQSISIKIVDSGIGISEEQLQILRSAPKKLEPNIVNRVRDGWGIGLKTMMVFTRFLEGDFTIDSKENIGTEVSFTFPVTMRQSEHKPAKKALPAAPQNPQQAASKALFFTNNPQQSEHAIRVLIIDNCQKYIAIMADNFSPKVIKRDDVEVTFTTDTSLGLTEMEKKRFDLILVDYHMEKDGLYVLRYLAEHDTQCTDSKVYIVTADCNISPEIESQMLELSEGILMKGNTTDQLKDLLRRVSLKVIS